MSLEDDSQQIPQDIELRFNRWSHSRVRSGRMATSTAGVGIFGLGEALNSTVVKLVGAGVTAAGAGAGLLNEGRSGSLSARELQAAGNSSVEPTAVFIDPENDRLVRGIQDELTGMEKLYHEQMERNGKPINPIRNLGRGDND